MIRSAFVASGLCAKVVALLVSQKVSTLLATALDCNAGKPQPRSYDNPGNNSTGWDTSNS